MSDQQTILPCGTCGVDSMAIVKTITELRAEVERLRQDNSMLDRNLIEMTKCCDRLSVENAKACLSVSEREIETIKQLTEARADAERLDKEKQDNANAFERAASEVERMNSYIAIQKIKLAEAEADAERFKKELEEAAKLMNGGYYYKVRDLLADHDALKGNP